MGKTAKPVSEIDRLIQLASEEKPRISSPVEKTFPPVTSLSLEDQKDPRPSMWRLLIQLRVLLPYLAKVLPLVERGLLGTNLTGHASPPAPAFDSSNLEQAIAGLGEAQRDLNTAVKSQTADIKFLQEQVTWLSKSLEKNLAAHEEISAGLAALRKMVTAWAIVTAVLLTVLIGLAAFAVFGHSLRGG